MRDPQDTPWQPQAWQPSPFSQQQPNNVIDEFNRVKEEVKHVAKIKRASEGSADDDGGEWSVMKERTPIKKVPKTCKYDSTASGCKRSNCYFDHPSRHQNQHSAAK